MLKLLPHAGAARLPALPYARLGDSDSLQVGDPVFAMGNPLMLSSSMTMGIVSNTHRVFTDFTGTEIEDQELDEGETTGLLTRWIQHDALILPGNSGGPLVNADGEVVGINELGADGVGFAIPSNLARSVLQQIVAYGRVARGWLGITVLPVSKLDLTTGALVSSVDLGSPAQRAGLLPGDIILAVNSLPVRVRFFEEAPLFYQQIASLKAGQEARLVITRNGMRRSLLMLVEPMRPSVGPDAEVRSMGLTVRGITPLMALQDKLDSTQGVLVTGVRPGYPFESAQPAIEAGDVIQEIDGKPTPNLAAMRREISRVANAGDGGQFAVAIERGDERIIAIVKTGPTSVSEDEGDIPQAWLGVKTQVMTRDVARSLGTPGTTGFRVTQVYPYTEASRSGLKVGDVITSLNGSPLGASRPQDAGDLDQAIQQLSVGDTAQVGLKRLNHSLTVAVRLEPTPGDPASSKTGSSKLLDFTVRDITLMDRVDNRWTEAQEGVIVTDAETGGWANVAGLHVNDLIVSLNDRPIANVSAFDRTMADIIARQPKIIRIFLRRDYRTHFVFIEPDWSHLAAAD